MQTTKITGAFSTIERVKLIRFAPVFGALLPLFGVLLIAVQINDWGTKVVFIILLVGVSIFASWKYVGFLRSGLQVLLKGEADIEINANGFLFKRRKSEELYPWKMVKRILLCTSDEEKIEYEIDFELKDGRDIIVEDDSSWTNFQIMRSWSNGYLDQIGWKKQKYDAEKNTFVDSNMPA